MLVLRVDRLLGFCIWTTWIHQWAPKTILDFETFERDSRFKRVDGRVNLFHHQTLSLPSSYPCADDLICALPRRRRDCAWDPKSGLPRKATSFKEKLHLIKETLESIVIFGKSLFERELLLLTHPQARLDFRKKNSIMHPSIIQLNHSSQLGNAKKIQFRDI